MSERADIKVLLVDDEETLLEYLSKRLLREGFIVKATFSGEEAVAVAGKGTGLGIPISHDFIKNLGGSISLESEPGEGTTFTIRLPVS